MEDDLKKIEEDLKLGTNLSWGWLSSRNWVSQGNIAKQTSASFIK
jgi:hypothetical protein